MKPYHESKITMHDCPKCGSYRQPKVRYITKDVDQPFLWIECQICKHGEHMTPKDQT